MKHSDIKKTRVGKLGNFIGCFVLQKFGDWKKDKEKTIFMAAKLQQKTEISKDSVLNLVQTLRKKNKFKWFGYHLSSMLYYQNPDSSIRTAYKNSLYCCKELYQGNGQITAKYCKNRWCPQCQRIRMGVLIDTYAPRLQKEKNLYFITLTRPNVRAEELENEIRIYNKKWQSIRNSKWYRRATILEGMIGIKKLECTYHATRKILKKKTEWKVSRAGKKYKKETFIATSEADQWFDTYHPHLHILVNNEQAAINIKEKWLKINPEANPAAQDLRKVQDVISVDENGNERISKGYLEVFKYFTKLIAKDSCGKRFFDAKHMNVIFEAMNKKQVYKRIGSDENWQCGEVDEEDIEERAALFIDDMSWKTFRWIDGEKMFGYYDVDTGDALTEMAPPQHLMEIINHEELKGKELELFDKKSTQG